MCGIIGSIGQTNNPIMSYIITSHLLKETEKRGKHATGFYSVGIDDKINIDKQPIKSSVYIRKQNWKRNLAGWKALIGHCRFATQGDIKDNRNNHPFMSPDENVGFVHNGIVHLYDKFKDDYKSKFVSECDSEIILQMILAEESIEAGIKKVYKNLGPGGDFACEIIHKNGENIDYYFFRDDNRPGLIIDCCEELGQYFIVSEKIIWKKALKKSGFYKKLAHCSITDLDPFKIYKMNTSEMKLHITEVEKPEIISKVASGRRVNIYSHYDDDYGGYNYPYNNYHNRGNYRHETIKTKQKTPKSVIEDDPNWTESTNSNGLPLFIYEPDDESEFSSIDQHDKEVYIDLLKRAVNDASQRWDGWEEEAFNVGVITYQELQQYRYQSDDIMDRGELIDLDDYDMTQQDDNEFLNNLQKQIEEECC